MWRAFLVCGLAFCCSLQCLADQVVAVIGSEAKPYKETLLAFQEAFGEPVETINLSENSVNIPRTARLIVAIGGKAALQTYPADVPLVYCLSPGILLPEKDRKALTAKIYMTPSWEKLLTAIKELQPELHTLGILTLLRNGNEFDPNAKGVGNRLGLDIKTEQMSDVQDLPDYLRRLTHIDALWIPPDPHLITPQNFRLLKDFCQAKRIPLYAPTVELMDQGTFAAIAPSFRQIGRCAAEAAKKMLSGPIDAKIHPNMAVIAVSQAAASEIGIRFTEQQLKKIDRLLP